MVTITMYWWNYYVLVELLCFQYNTISYFGYVCCNH